jgi:FkbM family methyltransferase
MKMNLTILKQYYWRALTAWSRWRKPSSTAYSPHNWMDAIAQHLPRDKTDLVYVDGGAHDGQVAGQFLNRFPGLQVHAFEPNADLFPRLEANLAHAPGQRHQLALSDKTQTLKMFINESPMTSSVLPRNENCERYFDAATTLKEVRELQATSLDDWFDRAGLNRVDIIKLDLQGYELQALRGAEGILRRGVACVYIEINFVPFYEGSVTFGEIDSFMRSRGYKLFNLYNTCTHLPEGQIGSGDALYVLDRASNTTAPAKAA